MGGSRPACSKARARAGNRAQIARRREATNQAAPNALLCPLMSTNTVWRIPLEKKRHGGRCLAL